MPTGPMYLRPWRELIVLAKKSSIMKPWGQPIELPCRMVLTLSRNGNGLLNVRCECMAGTVNKRPGRYYNYEPLGERLDFQQARDLWKAHLETKGEDHGEGDARQQAG